MSEYLEVAKQTALEAGKLVLDYYNSDNYKVEDKSADPFDYLTDADKASQELIIKRLKEHFPDHGVRAEENNLTKQSKKQFVWIIDPIDGTKEFVQKTGEFCVQIALTKDHKPILGVVYIPIKDQLFYAEEKSFLNDKEIHVSNRTNNLKMAISNRISYDKELKALYDSIPSKKQFVQSTGIKLCLIAKGDYDLTLYKAHSAKEWDFCAPGHILEKAGGKLTTKDNKPLSYNRKQTDYPQIILASNNQEHQKLLNYL